MGAVAADGFADFAEGGAGGLLYFGDLLGGACGVAFDEAPGELGFEDDDGESVAEDVVEIAGDAFAFGDGGESDVFFLGDAEFGVGASLLGEEDSCRRR